MYLLYSVLYTGRVNPIMDGGRGEVPTRGVLKMGYFTRNHRTMIASYDLDPEGRNQHPTIGKGRVF